MVLALNVDFNSPHIFQVHIFDTFSVERHVYGNTSEIENGRQGFSIQAGFHSDNIKVIRQIG